MPEIVNEGEETKLSCSGGLAWPKPNIFWEIKYFRQFSTSKEWLSIFENLDHSLFFKEPSETVAT